MSIALSNVLNVNAGSSQAIDIQIQLCGVIASISDNKAMCAVLVDSILRIGQLGNGKVETPMSLVPGGNGKMRSLITIDADEGNGNNNGSPAASPLRQ